VKKFYMRL